MASKKLEGVGRVKCFADFTKTGNCKYRKPTLAELKARQAISERSHSASTEIRVRAGLDALPPTFWRVALDGEIAKRQAAPPKRTRMKTVADATPSLARVEAFAAVHGYTLTRVA